MNNNQLFSSSLWCNDKRKKKRKRKKKFGYINIADEYFV